MAEPRLHGHVFRAHAVAASLFVALACRVNSAAADTRTNTDDDNFRPDVMECEDAVAHLNACCPGFDQSQLRCRHYDKLTVDSGCDTSSTTHVHVDPALSPDESTCILHASCDALRDARVCERAQAATSYGVQSSSSTDEGQTTNAPTTVDSHAPVCP